MKKKLLSLFLALSIIVTSLPFLDAKADAVSTYVTEAYLDKCIQKIVGESVLTDVEETMKDRTLTNERAAMLLERADEKLNGTTYNKDMYRNVVSLYRISDRKYCSSQEYKVALTKCFIKGIMPGKSNGNYTQSRKLSPKSKVKKGEADTMLDRLEHKSKRIKLTWDGQVTRKVNLPKNYKKYPYILASFPNSFYEKKFDWEYTIGTPKEYDTPADTFKYMEDYFTDDWADVWYPTIATNLKCRLNYNYLSTDFDKWSRTLIETWNGWGHNATRNYRKLAKANKTKIKSSKIIIEPSTTYFHFGTYYVRCYVRFRVDAKTVPKPGNGNQECIICGYNVHVPGLKNRTWTGVVVDIPVGILLDDTIDVAGGSFIKTEPMD